MGASEPRVCKCIRRHKSKAFSWHKLQSQREGKDSRLQIAMKSKEDTYHSSMVMVMRDVGENALMKEASLGESQVSVKVSRGRKQ